MLFQFSEQQNMIRDMAHDFAEDAVKPIAKEIDETERFPLRP